jgi:hypothetical protein
MAFVSAAATRSRRSSSSRSNAVATTGSGRCQGGVTVSLHQPTFRSSLVSYALHSNVLPCDLERREFEGYSASVIRIGSIVLRVDDLERQTAFWTAALDYVPRDEASDDFVLLRPKNGVGPNVSLIGITHRCRFLHDSISTCTQTTSRRR